MLSEKIERYLAIVEDRLRALPYQPTDEDLEGRALAIWLCEQVQQLQAEVARLTPDAVLGAAVRRMRELLDGAELGYRRRTRRWTVTTSAGHLYRGSTPEAVLAVAGLTEPSND